MVHYTQYHLFLRNDIEHNAKETFFMHSFLDYGSYISTYPDEENNSKRIENEG